MELARKINFSRIDRVALFGGSWLIAGLCRNISKRGLEAKLFTSPRHLIDVVQEDGSTLRQVLDRLGTPYCSTQNINTEPALMSFITSSTLGLAGGAAWVFDKHIVSRFRGKLLDFMGIPLPRYRGGAHYTWQILRDDRRGCCNLQLIHGGMETFHKGEVIKRKDYFFPAFARTPQDYFEAAVSHELAFLEEFFDEVAQGSDFELQPLQEDFSTYFPFLSTRKQGFINWHWNAGEIERFICGFDSPYAGASTFAKDRKVFLKGCHTDYTEGSFHPFQAGLVYRKTDDGLFVAARGGTLVVRTVLDENGENVLDSIQVGERLYTPQSLLEEALQFEVIYDAGGLRPED